MAQGTGDLQPPPARVVVIEASSDVRLAMVALIQKDARLQVVADVADGRAALTALSRLSADVVFVNGTSAGMDPLETTRLIMERCPVPIVVGTTSPSVDDATFRALAAGAVACVADPLRSSPHVPRPEPRGEWLQTLKAMSEVKVVRRRPVERRSVFQQRPECLRLVAVGASTGGPAALQQILSELPGDFPLPLLVVQHIARGFLPGMVDWLRKSIALPVQVAAQDMDPRPGNVYLAPDDSQLGLSGDGRIELTRSEGSAGQPPSVSHMFRSVSDRLGSAAIGVLLTGMGKDGAAELRLMRDRGSFTIAQDRATSIVHGMPGEAIALGGATFVLPLAEIAPTLVDLLRRPGPGSRGSSARRDASAEPGSGATRPGRSR